MIRNRDWVVREPYHKSNNSPNSLSWIHSIGLLSQIHWLRWKSTFSSKRTTHNTQSIICIYNAIRSVDATRRSLQIVLTCWWSQRRQSYWTLWSWPETALPWYDDTNVGFHLSINVQGYAIGRRSINGGKILVSSLIESGLFYSMALCTQRGVSTQTALPDQGRENQCTSGNA